MAVAKFSLMMDLIMALSLHQVAVMKFKTTKIILKAFYDLPRKLINTLGPKFTSDITYS